MAKNKDIPSIDSEKLAAIKAKAGKGIDDISWQDGPVSEEQWKMFHGNKRWTESGNPPAEIKEKAPAKINFKEP